VLHMNEYTQHVISCDIICHMPVAPDLLSNQLAAWRVGESRVLCLLQAGGDTCRFYLG
jgi:hypothetical protein